MLKNNTLNFILIVILLAPLSLSAQQFTLEKTIDKAMGPIFDIENDGICEYFVNYYDDATDSTYYEIYDGATDQLKYILPGGIARGDQVEAKNPYYKFPHIDYNSDGVKEIIMYAGNSVKVMDLKNNQDLLNYTFTDENVEFRNLIDIDGDGILELILTGYKDNWPDPTIYNTYVFSTGVTVTNLGKSANSINNNYKLEQNYPNPFNPSTTIEYTVPNRSRVNIKIYDINGQEIRELLNDEKSAGSYSIMWNGKNNYGSTVASGTYFYQIQTGEFVKAKKMIYLK